MFLLSLYTYFNVFGDLSWPTAYYAGRYYSLWASVYSGGGSDMSTFLVSQPATAYYVGAVPLAPNGPIGYRPYYDGAWMALYFQTPGLQCRALWGSLGIPGLCLADR